MLELAEDSLLSVQNLQTRSQAIEAELKRGTLAFSTTRGASKDGRTVAQIRVMGPKELRVYVWRGLLQFSYHGERETIAEGKS